MSMMVTSPGHTAASARRHRPVWEHSDTGWDIPEAGLPGAQRSTAVWEHWSTAACKQCRYVMRRNVGSLGHLEVVRHCCLGIVLQFCWGTDVQTLMSDVCELVDYSQTDLLRLVEQTCLGTEEQRVLPRTFCLRMGISDLILFPFFLFLTITFLVTFLLEDTTCLFA